MPPKQDIKEQTFLPKLELTQLSPTPAPQTNKKQCSGEMQAEKTGKSEQ
jgi:hypothetical protein